jgi:hypothetical protein
LLVIKMTEGDILWFTLAMPDLIVPKRLLWVWITIPEAEHVIFLIRQIWSLGLPAFRVSERNASREFIRRTWWAWWTFVHYPGNVEGSRS